MRLYNSGSTDFTTKMFQSVLNATLNLMFFRGGPQDFPYHPPLTGVLVPLTVLVNFWVLAQALPAFMAGGASLAIVIGTAYAARMLLKFRGKNERFIQTYHSLLVVSALSTLLIWYPFAEIGPEMRRIALDPEAVERGETLVIPFWAAASMNLVNIWAFVVNANIFRQSGEMGYAASLLVAMLMTMTILGLLLVFGVFLGILFPPNLG